MGTRQHTHAMVPDDAKDLDTPYHCTSCAFTCTNDEYNGVISRPGLHILVRKKDKKKKSQSLYNV